MIDFARARRTMIDTQIRVNDVTDAALVAAMGEVPREIFAPAEKRAIAYLDDDLVVSAPGAAPRSIMEPMVLARLIQVAKVGPDDVVLDVGPATGYSAAVLGRLAGSVIAVEEDPDLAAAASAALTAAGATNVAVVPGRLVEGAPKHGPFDVILLQGSVDVVPPALLAQLRDGGRLVAVVGRGRAARATVHTAIGGAVTARPVFDAAIPPLPGFEKKAEFIL